MGEKSLGSERISHSSIFWMLIGFVSFHCLVEVTLTAHKLAADIAAKSKSAIYSYILFPMSISYMHAFVRHTLDQTRRRKT
jgi:hypothetical protein